MVVFDFVCDKCNTIEERLVNREDVDVQICSKCSGWLTRQLGATHGYLSNTDNPVKYSVKD